jgi:hypothetical protein
MNIMTILFSVLLLVVSFAFTAIYYIGFVYAVIIACNLSYYMSLSPSSAELCFWALWVGSVMFSLRSNTIELKVGE